MPEWPAGLVELQCLAAKWNLDTFGGGKSASVLENTRSRVDLYRGVEQQILNCRMQILSHHQTGLRSYQDYIGLRQIFC